MQLTDAPRPVTTTADWRTDIPEPRRRLLRGWFWSIAGLTLAVLIVGGVTRLTHSGLSIVDWDPIIGVVPPIGEARWAETFERYQQFPEYQRTRSGMSLDEFKFIYFWEYLHRLLARGIGLVFLVPFAFFTARGYMNRPLALRSLGLFALGAMQGLMGWLMVASGLVDRPSVSHYRLAAHLSLAFLIFGAAVWLARELRVGGSRRRADSGGAEDGGAEADRPTRAARTGSGLDAPAPVADPRATRRMRTGLRIVGALFAAQVVWGAFVAGLRAGFFSNTFPLMAGRLVPPDLLRMDPTWLNFLANPTTVQWTHRLLGTVLAITVVAFAAGVLRARPDRTSRRFAAAFLAGILVQYVLGAMTLLHVVALPLAVAHQATALVLFGVWVGWAHHVRELGRHAAVSLPRRVSTI